MPDSQKHGPLIIDVAGTRLLPVDRERLRHPLVGGVVLFTRNWQDRTQLARLCAAIKSVRADILICTDHEGGRVQRFRGDGFTDLPAMRALGALWPQDPCDENARMRAQQAAAASGYVLGSELRACGVDLSFAPVLDLDWGRSAVIGTRSLARGAAVVAMLAHSLLHGMRQAGLAHCAKHFPGHGFAREDSHMAQAVDARSIKSLLRHDVAPYEWLGHTLAAVMPAHVVYPAVDCRPAGFSPRWLRCILRGQLGFGGAIFSDDLTMHGARRIDGKPASVCEAALAALHAGCDMVLLCNQSLVQGGAPLDAWLGDMQRAQRAGRWTMEAQEAAASAARRLALLPAAAAPPWDALPRHAAYIQARRVLQDNGLIQKTGM